VIRRQLIHSFTHAALSPEPDLAVAALMIARVEYPKLDAGPYLDQLDAIGREARLRVAAGGYELLLDGGQVHRVWTVEALADETVAWEGRDVPLVRKSY